jgi:hypothetical protein
MFWPVEHYPATVADLMSDDAVATRGAPRGDLAIRRSIERVVFEVRTEIANVHQEMADKCGEPPLD